MPNTIRLRLMFYVGTALVSMGGDAVDVRALFPEIEPYKGPPSAPTIRDFSLHGPARYRVTVTYAPWLRNTSEMIKWRSTVPIDGRDFAAWVEFIPGVVVENVRATPEPRVHGGTLVIVSDVAVRKPQPGMQVAIFPATARFGDGSMLQAKASASVVIDRLADQSQAAAAEQGAGGHVWTVDEPDFQGGIWHGVWTQRGDSTTYDAVWRHTSGREQRDVLEYRGTAGRRVTFWRHGTNGTYSGELAADGLTIVNGAASWYPVGQTWSGRQSGGSASQSQQPAAPAVTFDPGSVWTVDEPDFQGGTWHGVWTRRGHSNVYDAVWRHTSGREFRGTVEYRGISGSRVSFWRQDVNGTYYGQLEAGNNSVRRGTTSWYPAGQTWSGSITAR